VRLPVVYAVALELDAAGVDRAVIAQRLEVPVESVGHLLAVGRTKLEALEADR